MMQFRSQL